jgi:hypothetical protein
MTATDHATLPRLPPLGWDTAMLTESLLIPLTSLPEALLLVLFARASDHSKIGVLVETKK